MKVGTRLHRLHAVEPADSPEHGQLGGGIQAVTGLDFGRCGSVGEHGIEAGQALCHKVVDGGRPRGANGGHDAPAGGHDLQVGLAAGTGFELGGP